MFSLGKPINTEKSQSKLSPDYFSFCHHYLAGWLTIDLMLLFVFSIRLLELSMLAILKVSFDNALLSGALIILILAIFLFLMYHYKINKLSQNQNNKSQTNNKKWITYMPWHWIIRLKSLQVEEFPPNNINHNDFVSEILHT